MGYIKLWDAILDCPKINRLSDPTFRIWVKLLVTALRNGGPNGELPDMYMLKFRMRLTEEMQRCMLIEPCENNPIGGIPWRIHDWDDWQRPKDATGAERQARWRHRQALRNASHNGVTVDENNPLYNGVEELKNRRTNTRSPDGDSDDFALNSDEPKKPSKSDPPKPFILPDWVPRKEWKDFVAMRRKMPRRPFTLPAMELAVAKLAKLREEGDDPGEVLRRSVLHGWAGVFPLSEDHNKQADDDDPEPTFHRKGNPKS